MDYESIIGAWLACYAVGYTSGHIARWFQGIAEKL